MKEIEEIIEFCHKKKIKEVVIQLPEWELIFLDDMINENFQMAGIGISPKLSGGIPAFESEYDRIVWYGGIKFKIKAK